MIEPEATAPADIPDEEAWLESLSEDEGDEPEIDGQAAGEDAPTAASDEASPAPEAADARSTEPAVPEPATEAGDKVTEGEPEAPAPDAAALPEGETAAEEPKPAEPYTLRADGREIQLDGAMRSYGDDGQAYIVIPEATVQRQLQPHIADRNAWQEERARLLATKSENEIRAERLVEHFSQLMDADDDGSAMFTWFDDFRANKPALEKDLEIAVLKGQHSTREASEKRADQAESDRQYEEWAPGALRGAIDGALKLDDFKGVGLDAQELFDQLSGFGGEVLFWTAPEDTQAWGMTFKKGGTYPHFGRILRFINGQAGVARKLKARHEEVLAAREANKVALEGGDDGKPVVTASETPVLAGKQSEPPNTFEEWEESLREDD